MIRRRRCVIRKRGCRPIAMELLRDIEKRTVPFKDNFDNTTKEPVVLPSRFPNLLVNGVSGISAGFATEIPPHNLREVIDACIAVMDNPEIELEELMTIVQRPGFSDGRHHHGRGRHPRGLPDGQRPHLSSARRRRSKNCAAADSRSSSRRFRIRSSSRASLPRWRISAWRRKSKASPRCAMKAGVTAFASSSS